MCKIVLGVVCPPRTNFEVCLAQTVADVIDRWKERQGCFVAPSLGFGLLVAISAKERPVQAFSSVTVVAAAENDRTVNRYLVSFVACGFVAALLVPPDMGDRTWATALP